LNGQARSSSKKRYNLGNGQNSEPKTRVNTQGHGNVGDKWGEESKNRKRYTYFKKNKKKTRATNHTAGNIQSVWGSIPWRFGHISTTVRCNNVNEKGTKKKKSLVNGANRDRGCPGGHGA